MKIEVSADGTLMIRETINGSYHRRIIAPGQDYFGEPQDVFDVCAATHTPEVVSAYLDRLAAMKPTPEQELAMWRASAKCSRMQGKLTLGADEWAKIEAYRDAHATWAERVVIDDAKDWERNSQDIQFFGHLLGYTDEQMDAMFAAAMLVKA